MTEIRHEMKENATIVDLVKKVTIYDAIVNVKDGWDQLEATAIIKCFCKCGIHVGMFQDEATTSDEDVSFNLPDDYNRWFQDLLEVPWEEYLAYDDDLETTEPVRAPDSTGYTVEQEPCHPDEDSDQNGPSYIG